MTNETNDTNGTTDTNDTLEPASKKALGALGAAGAAGTGIAAITLSTDDESAAVTRTIADGELGQGEDTSVTITADISETADVDLFERFDTVVGTASLVGATLDGEDVSPSFTDLSDGGGVVLFDGIGPGSLSLEYTIQTATDAPAGTHQIDPNQIDINGESVSIDGPDTVEVIR